MKIIYDHDGELSLLGCCIIDKERANIACQSLKPEYFSLPRHVEIFHLMKELYSEGEDINLDNLIAKSKVDGSLDDLRSTLGRLRPMSMHSSFKVNLHNIVQNYKKSQLAELFKKLSENYSKYSIDQIYKLFSEFADDNNEISTYTPESMDGEQFYDEPNYEDWLTKRVDAYRSGQLISGLSTGFPVLDKLINGLNPSHYVIVAGLPGSGKTTFALQIMKYLIENNVKVGFFSLEMIKEQVWIKLLSTETSIPYSKISKGQVTDYEKYELLQKSKELSKNNNFFLQDASITNLTSLRSRMKYLVEAMGVQVLFIDYVTLIKNTVKYGGPVEQIQGISMEIREMLKELRVPGIIVSQLNRTSAEMNKPPESHHLYGSGQLEKDAHEILMLHKIEFQETRQLYIRKNRFGYLDKITYEFENGIFRELGCMNG